MSEVTYYLTFQLASDGAFGRGDGVAGLVDQEVQHDEYGCPYLGGKALKGILVNECADILAAMPEKLEEEWKPVADALFNKPGDTILGETTLNVGDAELPPLLREAIRADIDASNSLWTEANVLESLTTIRRQTAMNEQTGAPLDHTLRAIRVILRDTSFQAPLRLHAPPAANNHNADSSDTGDNETSISQKDQENLDRQLMLLAACAKAFRRAGTGRNRGCGRLKDVQLCDADGKPITDEYFERFCGEVL